MIDNNYNFTFPFNKSHHGLLIAEKPDLQRKIQEVYEDHRTEIPYNLSFTAQRGHLLTLLSPDEMDEEQKSWTWDNLPFVPEEHGGWQYKVIQEKKTGSYMTSQDRYNEIKKEILSGKYDFIVNAGDPDQEGELLIRIVLAHIGNKLPVMRFWTNDLTESHILNALKNLRDDDNEPMLVNLLAAAYGRQHSDYRFGMNISRASTLKMNGRVACGRVKTPILSIVCRREDEIENFVPKTSYGVGVEYKEGFTGNLFEPANTEDEEEESGIVWFDQKKDAEDIANRLSKQATIEFFEEKEEKVYAPKQYKLATLQIDAGKYGYSDGNTLRIIQKLYEMKLLSYPRTDCEYLSSNEDFVGILTVMRSLDYVGDFVRTITKKDLERAMKSPKWINDKALEESGHSAIRPTTTTPDFSQLDKDEAFIYGLVCRRFVAMFLPPLIQMKTKIIADIDGYKFRSTGKRIVDEGFEKIFQTKFKDTLLPKLSKGDELTVNQFIITEKKLQCPKHLTSPEIIAICENPSKYLEDPGLKTALGKQLKLGTPATRSPIIEQLIDKDKYLETKKEGKRTVVVPTPLGRMIIRNLGPCQICKIDMTGEWELKLEDIRTGKRNLSDFEEEMKSYVVQMIDDIKRNPMTPFPTTKPATKKVGICPVCGKDILESEKGFSCSGYVRSGTGCNIKLWKNKLNATFDINDAMTLWKGGSIEKTVTVGGITMEKTLIYDFKEFDIKPMEKEEKIAVCPTCGGSITASSISYKCDGCDIKGSRIVCGAELSNDMLKELFIGGRIEVTCKKDDKEWNQQLVFDKKAKKIEFYSGEKSGYKCPCCNKVELSETDKAYKCTGCKFTFWKTTAGHTFTKPEIEAFMKDKKTPLVKFTGKKGPFEAYLVVDKKKKQTSFEFGGKL